MPKLSQSEIVYTRWFVTVASWASSYQCWSQVKWLIYLP
jgi:hypothetical protein